MIQVDDEPHTTSLNYIFIQYLNFLTFLYGVTLFIIDCIIYDEIKNWNIFIYTVIILSAFIILVTFYGNFIKNSLNTVSKYIILISFIELLLIISTIYIFIKKSSIVDFLLENMDFSLDKIINASKYCEFCLGIIKFLSLAFIFVLVNYINNRL